MANLDPIPATYCRTCGYCIHALPEPRCPECGTGFDLADPKTFRRRPPRHLLRRLVPVGALLAVLALPFVGGWGYFYYGWRQEQPAIAALTTTGLTVTTTPIGPRWLRVCTPPQLAFVFDRADAARFAGWNGLSQPRPLDGGTVPSLAGLKHLRILQACLPKGWGDDALGQISRIDSLEDVRLSGDRAGDDAVLSLGRLPKLRVLDFWFPVSKQTLARLQERRMALKLGNFGLAGIWLSHDRGTPGGIPSPSSPRPTTQP